MRVLLFSISAFCALAPFGADAKALQTQNFPEFSATEHFSGVFFSNFENATFFVCGASDTTCKKWVQGEAYTLSCNKDVCTILTEKIHEWEKAPDFTVYLRVELTGQRSLKQMPPKFLGDPGQVIQVEKIESVIPLQAE